ncbi:MAG: ABC transporter substrate-binding protein [Cyanophyceae cyanobacterium]
MGNGAEHWTRQAVHRRRFLQLAALFSTSAGLSAIASSCDLGSGGPRQWSRPGDRVRLGYLPITDASALLAAYHKGFLAAEGLEVDPPVQYPSWAAIAAGLQAGEVNVVHLLMPAALWLRYGEQFPGKVIAWNHTNGSALTVAPSINRLEDLAGRTVAIPFWYSLHNLILQMLLRDRGLRPIPANPDPAAGVPADAVALRLMPPPEMFAALANGAIAGYIVAEPYNAAAESFRVGKVLRLLGDVWRDHGCCVVVVPETRAIAHRDWTQALVNGLVKAQQWCRSNRLELAHLLSSDGGQYMPYAQGVLERVLAQYDTVSYRQQGTLVHPEWRSRRIDFQPYPFPSYTEALVAQLQQTLLGDRDRPNGQPPFMDRLRPRQVAETLVDASFVRSALPLVGGPQAFGLPLNLTRSEVIEP